MVINAYDRHSGGTCAAIPCRSFAVAKDARPGICIFGACGAGLVGLPILSCLNQSSRGPCRILLSDPAPGTIGGFFVPGARGKKLSLRYSNTFAAPVVVFGGNEKSPGCSRDSGRQECIPRAIFGKKRVQGSGAQCPAHRRRGADRCWPQSPPATPPPARTGASKLLAGPRPATRTRPTADPLRRCPVPRVPRRPRLGRMRPPVVSLRPPKLATGQRRRQGKTPPTPTMSKAEARGSPTGWRAGRCHSLRSGDPRRSSRPGRHARKPVATN